ncbi:MAG TPA: PASTA domain-containing protein [Vicinamibacterales bacterium]|nr:PASTA domain-containing protein [Vicinamibacterales bacterium]
MKFGTRVWGIGKLLFLVGAWGVTFLVFFFISMRVAMRAGQVQVPDLTGRTVSEATKLTTDLELRLHAEDKPRPSDKVKVGLIAQQDPPPGAEVRPQRTIRVWLSSGAQLVKAPTLVGQTERSARMRIEQDGVATTVSEFRSSEYQAEAIVAQTPPPSERASKVAVLVNRGEQDVTYVMPDVVGMDGARVENVLRGRGLRVSTSGSQTYQGLPPGIVVRQQPAAGTRVGAADAITLEVSR